MNWVVFSQGNIELKNIIKSKCSGSKAYCPEFIVFYFLALHFLVTNSINNDFQLAML